MCSQQSFAPDHVLRIVFVSAPVGVEMCIVCSTVVGALLGLGSIIDFLTCCMSVVRFGLLSPDLARGPSLAFGKSTEIASPCRVPGIAKKLLIIGRGVAGANQNAKRTRVRMARELAFF